MAKRYFAFLPRIERSAGPLPDIGVATGLSCVLRSDQIVIFSNETDDVIALQDGGGALVGHVFSNSRPRKRLRSFEPITAQDICESGGQNLIGEVWGGYVAFVKTPHHVYILRDPSGALPCLYFEHEHGLIISSDVETLVSSGFFVPGVDWSSIPRFLYAFDLRTSDTSLTGLKELLAGFRLKAERDRYSVDQIWSPWDYVDADTEISDQDLSAHLGETINDCVQSWAGSFKHILLGISGGLDSSIVAACLASLHGTEVTCLTMATDDAEGDERAYARLVAQALHLPLVEAFHDINRVDINRTTAGHLPRPLLYAFGQSEHQLKFDLARERQVDAFMSGIGGDNVFCFLQSANPVVDRLKTQGITGAWETIGDVCRLTGCSVWDVLRMAFSRFMDGGSPYTWRGDDRFLNPDLISDLRGTLSHPWLRAPLDALPGKAAHIASLVRIQGTIDGFSRLATGPQINPLLSQPIIEACLLIPSWRWCNGGVNRSVAREAFTGILPETIIKRRSKGGPNSLAFEVIDANRSQVKARLLNGNLARENIIDRKAIEAVLAANTAILSPDHMRLSALAELETWADHWASRRARG